MSDPITTFNRAYDAHGALVFAHGDKSYAHLGNMACSPADHLEQHLIHDHGVDRLPVGDGSWCRRVEEHAALHSVTQKPSSEPTP